jgi:FkbM family methyltransferase
MAAVLKSVARALIPRGMRNWLRSPGRSLRWITSQRLVTYQFAEGWSFRAPKIAVDVAFESVRHDPAQQAEFREFVGVIRSFESPLMVDLGCHFGIFAFTALHFGGPGARVVAVDASKTACEMTARIASANGWEKQLDIRNAAIGREEGVLEMIDGGALMAGYCTYPTDQPAKDRIRVPQTTVDKIVAGLDRPPDILKFDVESFEYEALQGATETLRKHRPVLCIEMHNQFMRERGVDPLVLLSRLASAGYGRITLDGREIDAAQAAGPAITRIVVRKNA